MNDIEHFAFLRRIVHCLIGLPIKAHYGKVITVDVYEINY